MNTYLKLFVIIFAVNLLPWVVWGSDKDLSTPKFQRKQCEEARYGNLSLNLVQTMDLEYNSYLFDCAVSVVVSFPNENVGERKKRKEKKLKVADFFISKGVDVTYRDETGSTLLMAVVVSYMPREWKAKVVKILVAKGSNIHAKNNFNKTVLDLAKFTEDLEIVAILSASTK